MHFPGFTAGNSLYRSQRTYRSVSLSRPSADVVSPAEGYACEGATCTCDGAFDCIGCVVGGHCTASCTCSETSCVCVRDPYDYR